MKGTQCSPSSTATIVLNRRSFLKVGSLALGGLSLDEPARRKANAQTAPADPERSLRSSSCSCTAGRARSRRSTRRWPPRPRSAAPPARCTTRSPASPSAASFPKLAALADRLAVVRSFVPGDAQPRHQAGRRPRHASARTSARVYARVAGANHPDTGMPTNVAPVPAGRRSVDAAGHARASAASTPPARLGAAYAPFDPGRRRQLQNDMKLTLADGPARRPPLSARAARPGSSAPLDDARRSRASTACATQASRTVLGGVARGVRPVEGRPTTRRPLRHRAARPAREHRQEVEELQQLRRQRQVARQAAAAGPPAVRARLRLRDGDDELRLGHARRRQQRHGRRRAWATWARRSTTPCRRSSKTSKARGLSDKILLVVLRRDGPHAEDQQERRPRPLGQPRRRCCSPAAACRWAR